MSGTMGRFAKGLFSSEKNKASMASFSGVMLGCGAGGTQGDSNTNRIGKLGFLCATPAEPVNTEEERDSNSSWSGNLDSRVIDENDQYHVDGFSYVDESVEEEYYDVNPESFEETERQFERWDKEHKLTINNSTSSRIPTSPPELHNSGQFGRSLEETLDNCQNTDTSHMSAKVLDVGSAKEADKNTGPHLYQDPVIESTDIGNYSKNNETPEDPARKLRRYAKVYEVGDIENENITSSQQESLESENYQPVREQDRSQNFRTLRHLPKVHDLHSVVTLKDLENKPSKQISWDTLASQGIYENVNAIPSSPTLEHAPGITDSTKETNVEPVSRESGALQRVKDDDKIIGSHYGNIDKNSKYSSQVEVDKDADENSGGFVPSKVLHSSKRHRPSAIITQHSTTTESNVTGESIKRTPVQSPISMHSRMASSDSSKLSFQNQQQYKSFILMYRSEVIARQFCLIERDILLSVQWDELVDIEWTKGTEEEGHPSTEKVDDKQDKGKKAKGKEKEEVYEGKNKPTLRSKRRKNGVKKVAERFQVACDWVSTEIVLTQNLDDRVRVIEKFIHIAQKCLQLSNFATLAQILLGLQSSPVERLRRTWTQVRASDMQILKELNEYISPFGNWKIIRDAMRQVVESSTIINELVKQNRRGSDIKKINTGCIPFLGLYLEDLNFNSKVPSLIDPTPSTPSTPTPLFSAPSNRLQQPLINFHKYRTTATIVKRVMAFQNLARNYAFPVDPDVYPKCIELKGVEATRLVVMDLDAEDYV